MPATLAGLVCVAALMAAVPARGMPVARPANLSLTVAIGNVGPITVTTPGSSVTVDEAAGTLTLAAGALSVAGPVSAPVTATTALASLVASNVSNAAASFRMGGAASQAPHGEIFCPLGLPGACVNGSGLGGTMPVFGLVNIVVVPSAVTVPLALSQVSIGVGGSGSQGFLFDAAPWTLGSGLVQLGTGTSPVTARGSVDAVGSRLSLVTPTFLFSGGNTLPTVTTLRIEFTDGAGLPSFVPEPGLALLVLLGAAGALRRDRAPGITWPRLFSERRRKKASPVREPPVRRSAVSCPRFLRVRR